MWRAYEFTGLPSRNRTLDSEVLGQNVGLPVNDTRLEVFVDFEKEDEARVSRASAPEEDTHTHVSDYFTKHLLYLYIREREREREKKKKKKKKKKRKRRQKLQILDRFVRIMFLREGKREPRA